jgi:cbb3-type cytochrome oxidase maturation protein
MLVTLVLFGAGIAMGLAGALIWAWGVFTGQFSDLEGTKEQLFWPDLAPDAPSGVVSGAHGRPDGTEDR